MPLRKSNNNQSKQPTAELTQTENGKILLRWKKNAYSLFKSYNIFSLFCHVFEIFHFS